MGLPPPPLPLKDCFQFQCKDLSMPRFIPHHLEKSKETEDSMFTNSAMHPIYKPVSKILPVFVTKAFNKKIISSNFTEITWPHLKDLEFQMEIKSCQEEKDPLKFQESFYMDCCKEPIIIPRGIIDQLAPIMWL
jgi:hypothetical protein